MVSTLQHSPAFCELISWSNLLKAYHLASESKRRRPAVSIFDYQLADRLLELQSELGDGCYQPGPYTNFFIHEPKCRKISAAPFRDRVVHHALCNIIEPRFEARFIHDSYANRVGKGTHRAVDCFQEYMKSYHYVLRCDIRQYFPSIDHEILVSRLQPLIPEPDVMALVKKIITSGEDVLADQYQMTLFPGDDLLSFCRPRGLPIGNLTSQFWANCYLHSFDLFIKRELGCKAYLRYVDDFALFSHSKHQLWQWKQAIQERLATLRLVIHDSSAQVTPVECGVPWLGFVVYPSYRRVKARKVRYASRRLTERYAAYQSGTISFAEFDAAVQGWINYVRYGDTWGLRQHVLKPFKLTRFDP